MINQAHWAPMPMLTDKEKEERAIKIKASREEREITNKCIHDILLILCKESCEENQLRRKLQYDIKIIEKALTETINDGHVICSHLIGYNRRHRIYTLVFTKTALTTMYAGFYFPDIAVKVYLLREENRQYENMLRELERHKLKNPATVTEFQASCKTCLHYMLLLLTFKSIEENELRKHLDYSSKVVDHVFFDAEKNGIIRRHLLNEPLKCKMVSLDIYRLTLTEPNDFYYFPDISEKLLKMHASIHSGKRF